MRGIRFRVESGSRPRVQRATFNSLQLCSTSAAHSYMTRRASSTALTYCAKNVRNPTARAPARRSQRRQYLDPSRPYALTRRRRRKACKAVSDSIDVLLIILDPPGCRGWPRRVCPVSKRRPALLPRLSPSRSLLHPMEKVRVNQSARSSAAACRQRKGMPPSCFLITPTSTQGPGSRPCSLAHSTADSTTPHAIPPVITLFRGTTI